jgi:nicotinate-nucleotide adenylyltransferase
MATSWPAARWRTTSASTRSCSCPPGSPHTDLYFITGADALANILTWHDVDALFSLAHFIGCTRPGHRLTGAGLPDGKVSLVEIPALAISSSECRHRVAAGEPVWYLVPDGVVQYIGKRGLYARS